MKYKVGDVVKIVPMEYTGNAYWRGFSGRVGTVVLASAVTHCVVGFSGPEDSEEFYYEELMAASDVEALAYKLRGE